MAVTLSGMVMPVKLVQPENAQSPMVVTPLSITTVLMLSQLLDQGALR